MNALSTDLRFALRLFRRSPWFYGGLTLVLVLGIGATTAMWSLVESVLLRPLPYDRPEQLSQIWSTQAGEHTTRGKASLADFTDWRTRTTTFAEMAAEMDWGASLASPGAAPEPLRVAKVSGTFFSVFGVHAIQGRLLQPSDDVLDGPPVVVLSDELFHRRFHGDPAVVGRAISLDAQRVTVVGIAPPGFKFASVQSNGADAWLPMATSMAEYRDAVSNDARGARFLLVTGRRKPGVSPGVAQAEISGVAASLAQSYPGTNTGSGVFLEDLRSSVTHDARTNLWLLLAGVVFVFAILCANVTNLLLTRAQSRRGEMSTRAALGASPGRLARQSSTETVLLFAVGSLGGSLLSGLLVRTFATRVLGDGPLATVPVEVDAVALSLATVVSLACGLLAGVGPALWAARVAPQTAMKESAARAGVSRGQARVRAGLVVAQIAITCTLLIGTALALRTFASVTATRPGFDTVDAGYAFVSLASARYSKLADVRGFYHRLLERLAAEPGVVSVAGDTFIPMGQIGWVSSFAIEGEPRAPAGAEPAIAQNKVTVGYLRTMGIPLLRGRDFTDSDRDGTRPVMLLSSLAAEKYFPGREAIGQRLAFDDADPPLFREVIGVVGDVRSQALDIPEAPASYLPFEQSPDLNLQLVIRSPQASALLQKLPAIVESIDPDQAVSNRRLLKDVVAGTIDSQRTFAVLLASFALAALLLSALGVFGLVSYATAQRTREIGIRRSLGAPPGRIVSLVMATGLKLVIMGLVLGLAASGVLATSLGEQTAHALAFDPATYVAVPLLLAVVSVVACLLPARYAIRVPPAVALRYE